MNRKRIGKLVLQIAGIAAAAMILLLVVVDTFSGGAIVDFSMNFFDYLVYTMVWDKVTFFFLLFIPVLLIILVCALAIVHLSEKQAKIKAEQSLRMILESIDTVFKKGDALLSLPPEFADAENKLNAIRNENLRNERLAREAEQRKNDLVVYLAHDLKTPLTSVIGYLTLLRDEPQISEELRLKYQGIALDKARRLEDLINEFFDITRFSLQNIQLEPQTFDLNVMLQQLMEEFYPVLAEKSLSAQFFPEDQVSICADPDKLARVFGNLLRNAAAYSYPHTQIAVRMKKSGEDVVLGFENRGPGIPEQKQKMIFQKFYRLDESRSSHTGGAGLGLAIARELVELHGGKIWVTSSEEITRFCVKLPLHPKSA